MTSSHRRYVTDHRVLDLADVWANPRPGSFAEVAMGWEMLPDDQLADLVRIVIDEVPFEVASTWEFVEERLGSNQALLAELCDKAAEALLPIDRLVAEELCDNASPSFMLAVLRRMKPLPAYLTTAWRRRDVPAMLVLTELLVELGPEEAPAVLNELQPKFAVVDAGLLYRIARHWLQELLDEQHEVHVLECIEQLVWRWAEQAGYVRGVAVKTDRIGRKAQGVVYYGGARYICQAGSLDVPRPGDEILFRPDTAKHVDDVGGMKVFEVSFTRI